MDGLPVTGPRRPRTDSPRPHADSVASPALNHPQSHLPSRTQSHSLEVANLISFELHTLRRHLGLASQVRAPRVTTHSWPMLCAQQSQGQGKARVRRRLQGTKSGPRRGSRVRETNQRMPGLLLCHQDKIPGPHKMAHRFSPPSSREVGGLEEGNQEPLTP